MVHITYCMVEHLLHHIIINRRNVAEQVLRHAFS